MKNRFAFVLLLAPVILITIFAFRSSSEGGWTVPAKYQTMKNPYAGDKAALANGKELYVIHCKSCHGKEGLGDGPKAAQLKTHCGDFTDEDFQSQSDGAIFYKTTTGLGDMPEYSKKLPDDYDRWSIVNYLRTLE